MATAKNSTSISKTKGAKTTEKVKASYDPQKAAASKASAKKDSGKTCPYCGHKIGR